MKPSPLRRLAPLKRSRMKRKRVRRDWTRALEKVDREGRCRGCGRTTRQLGLIDRRLEAAHLLGRTYDTLKHPNGELIVETEATVPLCGPQVNTGTCHQLYDARKLDLWGRLTDSEREWAVRRLGRQAITRIKGRGDGSTP